MKLTMKLYTVKRKINTNNKTIKFTSRANMIAGPNNKINVRESYEFEKMMKLKYENLVGPTQSTNYYDKLYYKLY